MTPLRSFLQFRGSNYPVELQALGVKNGLFTGSRFAHAFDEETAVRLATEAERWGAQGVFVVMNAIDPAVATRAQAGKWHQAAKGEGTTDADICSRLTLYADIDARRARGTSATHEEKAHASSAAARIADDLRSTLSNRQAAVSPAADSGNGGAVFLALDAIPETPELASVIKEILGALDTLYSDEHVHVDTSVSDAKRLCPAFGSTKRKGAAGVPERPHRPTDFTGSVPEVRLQLDDLVELRNALQARLPQPQGKPSPSPRTSSPKVGPVADDAFTTAKAVPVGDVLSWLGLLDGDQPTCPGCGEADGSSVAIVGNGLKCSHARCSDKGAPGRAGFRTTIDLVAETRHVKPLEAANIMAEHFGFAMPRRRPPDRSGVAPTVAAGGDDRPTVRITTDLHDVVDQATAVLGVAPNVFERDRSLVHVLGAEGDRYTADGTPQIRPVGVATLREVLCRVARWERLDGRSKGWVRCVPTDAVVTALLARGQWPGVRSLIGIVEAPTLRPDGSVLATPGYDKSTRYLYIPSESFPAVPVAPTQGDAVRAYQELEEVFAEFPWRAQGDMSTAVAAVLTMVARPAIAGAVPAFVFDKNTRGSGGTLLADVCTIIPYSRATSKMTWPTSDEEVEKVLGAYALRGAAAAVFDNLTTPFGGGPLDRSLTAEDTVTLRVLGRSEAPELRWRTVVLATGNNVEVHGDTCRRVLIARLESPLERPEERAGFRHPDLRAHVRQRRGALVVAALTILRAHALAGRPRADVPAWGSFEAWTAVVPAAIVWAGYANPMVTRPTEGDGDDGERSALLAILSGWSRLAPDGITAKGAIDALYPLARLRGDAPPDGFEDLREAIETLVPTMPGKAPSPHKVGNVLRRFRRRVVGGRQLDTGKARAGVVRWLVVGGAGGTGGSVPNPSRGNCQSDISRNGSRNGPIGATSPTARMEVADAAE
ncbi:MAG: hypothetical protein WKG00_17805 [Polyangiaceae bacterium]